MPVKCEVFSEVHVGAIHALSSVQKLTASHDFYVEGPIDWISIYVVYKCAPNVVDSRLIGGNLSHLPSVLPPAHTKRRSQNIVLHGPYRRRRSSTICR